MKNALYILYFLWLLPICGQSQDISRPTPYADILVGLFPTIGDEALDGHVSVGVGVQFSRAAGLGLSLTALEKMKVSTSYGMSGIGLQYRFLTRKYHQLVKLEVGHLLNYGYGSDAFWEHRYEPGFDPYFKIYLAHRPGRFTFGGTFTYAGGIQEGIWEWDEVAGDHFDSGRNVTTQLGLFQLFIGLSLDSYRPVKRKKRKKDR